MDRNFLGHEGEINLESGDSVHEIFVRNVQHELRTPLAIVHGYAELLKSGDLGELAPEQQQAMFVIANRTDEMRAMVERIGVLLSTEAGTGMQFPLAPTELVNEVVKARRATAKKANLSLEANIEPDLPKVPGDLFQLRAALDCLLENALKFTPQGGHVEMRTYADAGWVCFEVVDTGIGIEPDKLSHLFDGFYQADGSITRRYGGLGLGLTVVKKVAGTHKGRLEVQSQLGQGSRFTLRLPTPELAQAEQQAQAAQTPRRILVVDDEESIATSLQAGLGRLPDCETALATSGEQALQLLERRPFNLLVTDYKLPGIDGLTLAANARQLYPELAIIMLTAYSSDEVLAQAKQVAIRQVLDKPIKLADVRAAAQEALQAAKADAKQDPSAASD